MHDNANRLYSWVKYKLQYDGNDKDLNFNVGKHDGDKWLVAICAVLLVIGLVVIYAISPALGLTSSTSGSYFVWRQLLAICLAVIVFLITANIPIKQWRKSYKLILVGALLATFVALILPVNPNYPAHRWVRFGSLSFESVDLLIFALLIGLADFLARMMKKGLVNNFKKTAVPLFVVLIIVGFIVAGIQSDLGSTGVIVAMMAVMAFIAGLKFKGIMIIGLIVLIGTTFAIVVSPYRIARVETFLHPDTNCQTTGYQACQAIIGVGSGGLVGLGLGASVQAYGYLPEADNDSIFAIYAEKFGFIGSIILLALFGALFSRINKVALRAPDDFSRLFVVGVLIWISIEALINIGAMIGLLPIKGITLPFISYGGTSVIFFAAAVGLVYQISRYTLNFGIDKGINIRGKNDTNSSYRGRVGRPYHPNTNSSS